MKSVKPVLLVLSLVFSGAFAHAQEVLRTNRHDVPENAAKTNDLGLGVRVGHLVGLDLKYWANESDAWAGSASFQNGNTALAANRLWHYREAGMNDVDLVPYAGAGLVAIFGRNSDIYNRGSDTRDSLAVQIPIGVEWTPRTTSFGAFFEITPGVGIIPGSYSFLSASLGARLYM